MTKQLLQQALDALRQCEFTSPPAQRPIVKEAITALREALAAPQAEPVAWMSQGRTAVSQSIVDDMDDEERCLYPIPLYAAPPAAPADIVMVPREPTQEMIEAADQSDKEYSLRVFGHGTVLAQSGYDHWVAMIAAAPPAAPAVPDGMKPVGYTHPFYLQVKQVGGFTCQYESFGLFTAPLYAAPVVREPLTDEQLEEIVAATGHGSALFDFARAIEAAHGITGGSNG